MKLTKKSEAIQKKDDSLPVLEAEIIDDEVTLSEKSEISQREKKLPLAYTFGKIAGYVGSFLFGVFKNKDLFYGNKDVGKGGMGRGFREKRRRKGGSI